MDQRSLPLLVVGCVVMVFGGAPLPAQMPVCPFDVESLAFAGSPLEQANCLLRPK